jgi:hypothetical protein
LCSVYSEPGVRLNIGLLQPEHQASGDEFQLKREWAKIQLCLVRASSCLYFMLCSVSSEPSVNVIRGLLQTQHQANGDEFQLKIQWAEIQLFLRASSCLYFMLCSVYSEPSVNMIMGLLQTEHQGNGDEFQL